MTELTPSVVGAVTDGIWLSISALAAAKGISKQAVSKRLATFGSAVSTKKGSGGSVLVNAVEYDRACGEIGDTLRMVLPKDPAPPGDEPETSSSSARLTDNRALIAQYDAENKRLDLELRLGKLVEIDAIHAAMTSGAAKIAGRIEQIHTRADDCAAAVARDGVAGAKAFLRTLAEDLLGAVAKDFNPDTVAASRQDG